MKQSIRLFALLDFLSLIFMGMELWAMFFRHQIVDEKFSEQLRAYMLIPMFLLVLIAAVGFMRMRRFACVLYYIQFPFRLYLWVFTWGFITLLPEAFGYYGDAWPAWLLKLCFVLEFLRLYVTIRFHREAPR